MQATFNGLRLNYTDEGRGLPLLFVHGFPLCCGAWQKQVDALRASYRVIVPDLRGFGDSEGKPGTTSMAEFAADLHGLLQQLNTGPVVLIGHSMGGYVALAFARQFPAMLRGLVLVSTKAGTDTPEVAAGRRATAEKVRAEGVKLIVDAMAAKMLAASNPDATMAEQMRELMAPSRPEGAIAALLGMAERPDSTPMLAGISVPTLVVTGADDGIIPPAESEKLAPVIPGAQLSVIPRAGHLVAFEQPDAFNRVLTEWLESGIEKT
jgi:pimeloyl-ACP methyl ester carboxylesterase